MKQFLLIAMVLLGSFSTVRAQEVLPDEDDGEKMKKIEALYVAFITKQLNLTTEDAQKFWPIHAEFERDLRSVPANLPELERQQRLLDIKKRYQDRFNKVLGSGRTENFFRKDVDFRRKLAEHWRKMKQRRQNIPPRRRA